MSVISKNDNAFYESIVFSQEAGDTDWCKYKPVLSYKQPKLYIDSSNTTSTTLELFNQPLAAGQMVTVNQDNLIINGAVGTVTNTNPTYNLGVKAAFLNAQSAVHSSAYLPNGNIFVAFIDTANSNFASIMILDKNGYVIQSKIAITTVSVSFIDCCTLSNGNVCIAYIETASQDGYSTVYSQTGSLINIKYRYASTATQDLKIVALKYDKFAIVTTPSTYGLVYIFSNNNAKLTQINLYITSTNISYKYTMAALQNGNIISFGNEANTNIYYNICTDTALKVKATTALVSTSCSSMSATTMTNGNVFFAYAKSTTNACFQILDPNGVVIKTETVFNTGNTTEINTLALPNGNVSIFFKTADTFGKYMIYDNLGNVVKSLTTFNSSNLSYLNVSVSDLGDSYLTYFDATNSVINNIDMKSKQTVNISGLNLSTTPTKAYRYSKPSNVSTALMPTGKARTSDVSLNDQTFSYSKTNIIVNDLYNRILITPEESIKYAINGTDKVVKPISVTKTTLVTPVKSFDTMVISKSKVAVGGSALKLFKVGTKMKYLDNTTIPHSIVVFNNMGVIESRVYSATQFNSNSICLDSGKIVNISSTTINILDPNGNILYTRDLNADSGNTTGSVNGYGGAECTPLTNGNFVVHYNIDTGTTSYILNWYFIIYDSLGNIVYKSTSYYSYSGSWDAFGGLSLTTLELMGGDFLTLLNVNTSATNITTGTTRFMINNSSGGVVKAMTTLLSYASSIINVKQLTAGNIVFAGYYWTDAAQTVYQDRFGIYSSSGSAIRSYSTFNSIFDYSYNYLYTLPNGNFGLGNSTEYGEFNASGGLVSTSNIAFKNFPISSNTELLMGNYLFAIDRATLTNSYWSNYYKLKVLTYGTYYEYNIAIPTETVIPNDIRLLANGEAEKIVSETISNDTITCTYRPKIKTGRDMQIKIVLDRDCEMASVNYVMSKALP